ncbi:C6 zinc finger domain protein [Colletotrichum plurivorum]|uniref:C6 zinc finger domain protein n=1 Tax=Colletotrichum plurivorum TaxID=2175906 RepID=A0A8H6JUK6_9PEZI|nr:C6 zinc finger domain protein [Colletotrichum plurivorum]
MARKGSRKVRTGCITCKIRRVKCDEARPACRRCSATGRTCDGYQAPPSSELRPIRPYVPSIFPGAESQAERRAIQFFCEMAAPDLPGATEPFFWTHLVPQFSSFVPAVRHALVAVSTLYEDASRTRGETSSLSYLQKQPLRDNGLALMHYNAAIREMVATKDESVVLLVCVLFICVELLQCNREAALRHTAHGSALLSSPEAREYGWVRQWVTPLFRRLNTLQYFFGGDRAALPDLSATSTVETPSQFADLNEAEAMIDDVFNQVFRLVRQGDAYRVGRKRCSTPPAELVNEQRRIGKRLDAWYTMFMNLEGRLKDAARSTQRIFALVRYRISRVWSSMAFDHSEMAYDRHLEDLRLMVEEVSQMAGPRARSRGRNNFEFEMGFIAPVSFAVMKCRSLTIRLEALRCLQLLAAPRESLWRRDSMVVVCKRVVELEHGTTLDSDGRRYLDEEPVCPGLPPVERRVAHFVAEFLGGRQQDFHGHEIRGKKVVFVMNDADGGVHLVPDELDEEPVPLPSWSPNYAHDSILATP